MLLFDGAGGVPPGFGPSAVTIGKFDGMHVGHRAIIADLQRAAGDDLAATVVTFDRNPLALLAPERCPPPLTGMTQRLETLEDLGVAATLLLRFDAALAALPAEEFVERILVDALHTRALLIGDDFRFGAGGKGDRALLTELGRRHGFEVQAHARVAVDGRRVSSTWIRGLLADGDIGRATTLLGRPPQVRGTVVHGAHRGRELGFPTANLAQESDGLIPADGVYAGVLTDHAGVRTRYPAAISVGSNPTFEGVPPKQVEAHVLDTTLDLYGHTVDVEFVHRIRGQVAYAGLEPLIAQITDDVALVRGMSLA